MNKYDKKFNSNFGKFLWAFMGVLLFAICIIGNILNWPLGINGLDYSINILWKIIGIFVLILLGSTCILISLNIKYSISMFTASLIILYITNFFHPAFDFNEILTMLPSYGIILILIFLLIRWEIRRLKNNFS